VIRALMVALTAVPVTFWYAARAIWAVYRNAPDAQCKCEEAPRMWSRALLRAAGVRVVVENLEVIDESVPQILVSNHVSWFDVFALAAIIPGRYLFVAKREVRKVPFLGWAADVCGHIYIDRKDHQSALLSLQDAKEKLAREKPTVIMFPEGTRSETGELQRFKKGAFVMAIETGAEIVPAAILGSRAIMPKHSLLIRSGTMTVRFGEPIPVAGLTLEQRDDLMRDTRKALAGLLAAPTTTNNS
jgi:1-acyl-sn-glycerol-3-phosphate acyltransferase